MSTSQNFLPNSPVSEISAVTAGTEPQTLASVGSLVPSADGFVPVYLDASTLAAGTYVLTIAGETGTSTSNTRSEFVINAKRPSPPASVR